MFQVLLKDATVMKNLCRALAILDEPILRVSKKGIRVRQMDTIGSAMVDLEMPAKMFENYECDKDEYIKFQRTEFEASLSRVKPEQSVGLALIDENSKIAIVVSGGAVKTFTMPNFVVEDEEKPMRPDVNPSQFKAKMKLDSQALKDAVDDLYSVTGKEAMFIMKATANSFEMTGIGSVRSLNIVLKEAMLAIDCKKDEITHFGVAYFKDIVDGGVVMSGVVNLSFAKDRPVKLDFELPFEGTLTYYLAPRIMQEGETE